MLQEVEAVKFALHACKYYFPGCMGGLLVYECPPIFDALCKLVLSWIDIRAHCRLRRITRDTVTKYVSPENLPFHMGGKVWYFFPIFCNSSTFLCQQFCSSVYWFASSVFLGIKYLKLVGFLRISFDFSLIEFLSMAFYLL